MKLISTQTIDMHGSKYLEFELTSEELKWLTPSRAYQLAKKANPDCNLQYEAPPFLSDSIAKNDYHKLHISVGNTFKEELIKHTLIQFVKAEFLKLEDANTLFKSVSDILSVAFSPLDLNTPVIPINQNFDLTKSTMDISFKNLIHLTINAKKKTQPTSELKDDFGSGLTGLKGAFSKKNS